MPHGGEMAPMIRGTVRTKMLALKYFFVFLIFLLMGGATSWMSRNIAAATALQQQGPVSNLILHGNIYICA